MKKNWWKVLGTVFVFVFALSAHADTTTPVTSASCAAGTICNPLGTTNTLPDLLKTILTRALELGIPVVALAIIYSGFLFVSARGNSEKLEHARSALLYTLIGAAILLGAWAIANMISATVLAL